MTQRFTLAVAAVFAAAAFGGGALFGYRQGQVRRTDSVAAADKPAAPLDGTMPVRISSQARANLTLTSQPVKPVTYWRTIEVPGVVIDRPGVSDRGVIAPVTGVITKVHSHPGETVAA